MKFSVKGWKIAYFSLLKAAPASAEAVNCKVYATSQNKCYAIDYTEVYIVRVFVFAGFLLR